MPTKIDSDDAFSLVDDRLFFLLEDHAPFVDLFRPGNLIRYDGDRLSPAKLPGNAADFPQCELHPAGLVPRSFSDSSETYMILRYEVLLKTGEWRTQEVNRCLFECVRAILYWKKKIADVKWGSAAMPLIHDVNMPDVQTGISQTTVSNSKRNEQEGWSSLMQIEVTLNFNNRELLP